jgi:hypothetical protein
MGKLDGKIALVTGGNSGIGLATARRFAAEGAHVFITGRHEAELDAAAAAIGGSVTGVRSDVSDLEDLNRLYRLVGEREERLDILFANAGGEFVPLPDISEDHYDRTFVTNVKGTLFHRPEGVAADARWRFDHPDRFDRREHRHARLQRLCREQGRDPQLRAQLDPRPQGNGHPGQCSGARIDLDVQMAWPRSLARGE